MTCLNRRFGYVDFASEEDMQKAMELNGKKFMGQELKLDMPRSKDASQDGKKGAFMKAVNLASFKISHTLHFLAYMWLQYSCV